MCSIHPHVKKYNDFVYTKINYTYMYMYEHFFNLCQNDQGYSSWCCQKRAFEVDNGIERFL